MGNNRSSTSSLSTINSNICQSSSYSIPIKNNNNKNDCKIWKISVSARESFDNSQQKQQNKKEIKRIRNRSLILFQQPKLIKNEKNYGWWPLKRIKNKNNNENKIINNYFNNNNNDDEINKREELLNNNNKENNNLIDYLTSSENTSLCSSSITPSINNNSTIIKIFNKKQKCHFIETNYENKNFNNNNEFNQRRTKSFKHFSNSKTFNNNNNNRSTRFSTASGNLLKKYQFMGSICPITGLTPIQKRMIIGRFCKLKTCDLYSFCSSTYKNIFEKYPKLINYFCFINNNNKIKKSENKEIIIKEEENKTTTTTTELLNRRLSSIGTFKIIVKKFFNVLQLVLIMLEEGKSSNIEQLLLEFGGMHVNNKNKEKEENNNNNNNIITIIPQEYWQILLQSLLQLSNNVQKINENIKEQNLNISNNNYSKRSIEAWTLFCIFIVSKIRFGFVIECFLRFNFKNKMENNQKEVFKNNTEQIIYEYKIKSNSNENIVLNCK